MTATANVVSELETALARYRRLMVETDRDLSDAEIDEWVERVDDILGAAATLPVTTAAAALAVMDFLRAEGAVGEHSRYDEQLAALFDGVRAYIARTA